MQLFLKPPDNAVVDAKAFYELALFFGKDTGLLNLPLAQQWLAAGKMAEAKQLILSLVPQNAVDNILPQQAAYLLLNVHDAEGAAQIYRQALAGVREPYVREVRLDYLGLLQRCAPALTKPKATAAAQAANQPYFNFTVVPKNPAASAPEQNNSPLPAGRQPGAAPAKPDLSAATLAQSALFTERSLKAIASPACWRWRTRNCATGSCPPRRKLTMLCCAKQRRWRQCGWMRGAACSTAIPPPGWQRRKLSALLAQQPPPERSGLLHWCGWQLDRLLSHEVPPDPQAFPSPTRAPSARRGWTFAHGVLSRDSIASSPSTTTRC